MEHSHCYSDGFIQLSNQFSCLDESFKLLAQNQLRPMMGVNFICTKRVYGRSRDHLISTLSKCPSMAYSCTFLIVWSCTGTISFDVLFSHVGWEYFLLQFYHRVGTCSDPLCPSVSKVHDRWHAWHVALHCGKCCIHTVLPRFSGHAFSLSLLESIPLAQIH